MFLFVFLKHAFFLKKWFIKRVLLVLIFIFFFVILFPNLDNHINYLWKQSYNFKCCKSYIALLIRIVAYISYNYSLIYEQLKASYITNLNYSLQINVSSHIFINFNPFVIHKKCIRYHFVFASFPIHEI